MLRQLTRRLFRSASAAPSPPAGPVGRPLTVSEQRLTAAWLRRLLRETPNTRTVAVSSDLVARIACTLDPREVPR